LAEAESKPAGGTSRVHRLVRMLRSPQGGVAAATALAQALNILVMLVLDWATGPEVVGQYVVFLAYGAIVLVGNLLSYQWSVPNIDDGAPLRDLTVLLVGLSVGSWAVVGLGAWGIGYDGWVWLSALVGVRSLLLVGEQLAVRERRYAWLMFLRATPSLLLILGVTAWWLSGVQAGIELLWPLHTLSFAIVSLPVVWALVAPAVRGAGLPALAWSGVREVAVAERGFSLWVTPAQVFNRMAYDVPAILLEQFFGAAVAANYGIALRATKVPVVTFGQGISRVYHGDLAKLVRDGEAGAYRLYARARRLLWYGAAGTLLVCVGVLPPLVLWVMGEDYALSAQMMVALAPLIAINFVVSPLSVSFYVFRDQEFLFFHQLAYLVISLACFGWAAWSGQLMVGLTAFSVLSTLRYVLTYRRLDANHSQHRDQPPVAPEAS